MTEVSRRILQEFQVRKTGKQKTAFLNFMQERYPEAVVEKGGLVGNRNLVIGDVETAEVVLGAHYDTCARLPFPNFIMPKNIPVSLLYSLLVALPFVALGVGARALVEWLMDDFWLEYWAFFIAFFVPFVGVFMLGVPNPHTVNDNTSGVVTLVELLEGLSEEQRKRVAFVFFDNEENGLLGSMRFASVHKKSMKNKLLFNFDCVSDGDHLMLVMQKGAYGKTEQLKAAFAATEGKNVLVEKASNTMYPSDQAQFRCGVGFAALKHKKGVGYYLDRIHTAKDTVMDERNIELLAQGVKNYLG